MQIYDVGEDRELAHIAMELIEGHDLSRHTRCCRLSSAPEILERPRRAAEAPGCAHVQGSAAVLGAPACRSPEQSPGTPLDGRSGPFSPGVGACRLPTGQLPFGVDTQPRLMQDIAPRTPLAPSRAHRELPTALEPIKMRPLHEQPGACSPCGADPAADLRASAARLT